MKNLFSKQESKKIAKRFYISNPSLDNEVLDMDTKQAFALAFEVYSELSKSEINRVLKNPTKEFINKFQIRLNNSKLSPLKRFF